ncbi:hypothetical protein N656DRAFT_87488 [Canariomyces notabilis]|uniref:Uncharacterized protein n=1 Tax=Canariomyces notabilis TaxID=2074819 RepID=A0AAN6TDT5_9PEZI|nr:hypothetical protein N656DRAFT_87488 [Canariomyces arenarius]
MVVANCKVLKQVGWAFHTCLRLLCSCKAAFGSVILQSWKSRPALCSRTVSFLPLGAPSLFSFPSPPPLILRSQRRSPPENWLRRRGEGGSSLRAFNATLRRHHQANCRANGSLPVHIHPGMDPAIVSAPITSPALSRTGHPPLDHHSAVTRRIDGDWRIQPSKLWQGWEREAWKLPGNWGALSQCHLIVMIPWSRSTSCIIQSRVQTK